MIYSLASALTLSLICLPIIGMQDFNNPLHAVSTLMFKQMQKEEVLSKDLHDAHTQFKIYHALRNSPPLSRKKFSPPNQIAPRNPDEK